MALMKLYDKYSNSYRAFMHLMFTKLCPDLYMEKKKKAEASITNMNTIGKILRQNPATSNFLEGVYINGKF